MIWTYVSYKIDRLPIDPQYNDTAEDIRKQYQALDGAREIWRQWASASGGEVVNAVGDEGRVRIPAERLEDLPAIKERFEGAVGGPCSIGIGTRISEADQALKASQQIGGDKILLYGPEVQDILSTKEESFIAKAQPDATPLQGGGAVPPTEQQAEPGPEEAPPAAQMANNQAESLAPAASDPHSIFAQMADQQGQQDQQEKDQKEASDKASQNKGDLRQQTIKILSTLKERSQELEALQQQDPDLYASINGLVKVLIQGARQIFGQEGQKTDNIQKSENLYKEAPPGFSEEVMKELKAKHGVETAFKIAWAAHNKHKEESEASANEAPPVEKELDKAALEAGKTGRHNVILPVGAVKDSSASGTHDAGKIKVEEEGKTKWRSVRAGMVMSQSGSPISSRNAGGK
jgi:hypothetical protein